jgi:hypothetical protein
MWLLGVATALKAGDREFETMKCTRMPQEAIALSL